MVPFWWDAVERVARPALPGRTSADVCVVGAGYTGLWTAYYLAGAAPDRRIVVVEQRFAGYGASGRNGGRPAAFRRRLISGWVVATADGGDSCQALGP